MKPLATEKAVMMIEMQNILTFEVDRRKSKIDLKKKVEEIFDVKVEKIKTLVKKGKKIAYVKIKPDVPAIDIATKLGII